MLEPPGLCLFVWGHEYTWDSLGLPARYAVGLLSAELSIHPESRPPSLPRGSLTLGGPYAAHTLGQYINKSGCKTSPNFEARRTSLIVQSCFSILTGRLVDLVHLCSCDHCDLRESHSEQVHQGDVR